MAKEGFVGPGQGLGAGYVNFEPVRYVDERPTFWLNPHEANARSLPRGGGSKGRRDNPDVGGR